MTTYICKCGRSFTKSINADTTGYRLPDYGENHECFGCPYALPVTDIHWIKNTKSWDKIIRAWECRASQNLRYSSYARMTLGSKNTGSIYSLDLSFLTEIVGAIKLIDGISGDSDPPGNRGPQYGADGLYRLPITPEQNKKGIAAKQKLFDMFFSADGSRKDLTPEEEKRIVLKQIEEATMGKINLANINSGLNKVKTITESLANVARFEMIPSEFIELADYNPFSDNDTDESRESLAMSIQASGLIEPLAVNKKSSEKFKLISGEHRFTAIRQYLHWKTIPCMVFEGVTDDEAQLKLYEANTYREYSSEQKFKRYQELEQLLRRMKDSGKFSGGIQKAIADRLGVTDRQVRKYKAIDESLSDDVKEAVKNGEISVNDAYKIARPEPVKTGTSSGFASPAPAAQAENYNFTEEPKSGTSSGFASSATAVQDEFPNLTEETKSGTSSGFTSPATAVQDDFPNLTEEPKSGTSSGFEQAYNMLSNMYQYAENSSELKETYKISLEAISKQIAKPLIKVDKYTYSCPTCKARYGLSSNRTNPDTEYCSYCGQLTSGWRKECK